LPTTTKPKSVSKPRVAKAVASPVRGASARRASAPAAPAEPRRNNRAPNLVIVESPAKARTVENILGPEYRVIASVGHVRDLPPYGYGVEDFESFQPKYVVVKNKARGVDKTEVIRDIAEAAKHANVVYLSTDPDREGEAIAWHIREAAGIPRDKTKRVVFHEITKPAIEAAFAEANAPDSGLAPANSTGDRSGLNQDLVDAQQARRVLDRLIGFPLTWFVQKKVSRGASAGRVQSVALGLIVKREREIQDFHPVEYWTIHAQLSKAGRTFEAELARFPAAAAGTSIKPPFRDAGPSITDAASALDLVETFRRSQFSVSNVKKGTRTKSPAPPFTTSTFQQAASNRLNMGAQRAMSAPRSCTRASTFPARGRLVSLPTCEPTRSTSRPSHAPRHATTSPAGGATTSCPPGSVRTLPAQRVRRRRMRPSVPRARTGPRSRCVECSAPNNSVSTRLSGSGSWQARWRMRASAR